ncbi:MAG: hypothetical protein RL189_1180 [Pseudomonadota bacterium]|jgi:SAM-dependent methyltransferase
MSVSTGIAPAQSEYNRYYEADAADPRKVAYLKRNIIPMLEDLPREASILEIGPGRGALLRLLRSSGFQNLTAFEICTSFADDLRADGYSVCSGSSAVGFLRTLPPESIDALLLVDVLEHFPLEEGLDFLCESRRVIKPDGRIVIQTPNASGLFGINTFVADPTHATPWNELRLMAALRGSGFSYVNCQPMRLPASPANLVRETLRGIIFAGVRFLTRLCGVTPVQVLTHNLVCEARPVR